MIIGIDVREGVKASRAGKGEYVWQIVSGLIKSQKHQLVLFTNQPVPPDWQQNRIKIIEWRLPDILWHIAVAIYVDWFKPIDVYFASTSVIVPALLYRVPVVMTIFDFVSFLFPSRHQQKAVWVEKLLMKRALNRSHRLISISESTKQDAIKLFSILPSRVTVIPLSASFNHSQQPLPHVLASRARHRQVVLFVGTLEPRKNLVRLVEAFNLLCRAKIPAELWLAGSWGWQSDEIRAAINKSPFKSNIRVLGYVAPEQKAALYQAAAVFAYPSVYEGFGLPPLEAMACGCPVVAANNSSLPEVVDNAAILVNPKSTQGIFQALKKVITNRRVRSELIKKGFVQAKRFNWMRTVNSTIKTIEHAVKE